MFDVTTAAPATRREIDALLESLSELGEDEWNKPVRCVGWTITDLVAHLVAAATGQAEGLRRAVAGSMEATTLAFPETRVASELLTLLRDRTGELLKALDELNPSHAESYAPLPFGPVPIGLALQIVPLEYGFHRNDLMDALGSPEPLPPDMAVSILGILPGLLPQLAAGSAVGGPGTGPTERLAFQLVSGSSNLTIEFGDDGWQPVASAECACVIAGDDDALAQFAMGRIAAGDERLTVSDPEKAAVFKSMFPGP